MTEQKKPINPWTIIGWIVLFCVLAPIGLCFAGIAVDQYQKTHVQP